MTNTKLSTVLSLLALALTSAVVGCAADDGAPEEKGETTSNLSCKVVPTKTVVAGRTVTTSKVVCDGSRPSGATSTTTTSNGSSCTLNGRKMTCEGGGCRAVNGQPGQGCRWADGADAPDQDPNGADAPDQDPNGADPNGADAPDQDPDGADAPDLDPAGGTSSCTINGRKAVCDNGSCTAVNGQPGPGCRFVD